MSDSLAVPHEADSAGPVPESIQSRLVELAGIADDEGIQISTDSRKDLTRYIRTQRDVKAPSLYLVDSGNYRAVWWNAEGEQIALQFRGGGEVQYVIFARRDDAPGGMGRSSGRDGFRGTDRIIDAFDARRLMRS